MTTMPKTRRGELLASMEHSHSKTTGIWLVEGLSIFKSALFGKWIVSDFTGESETVRQGEFDSFTEALEYVAEVTS